MSLWFNVEIAARAMIQARRPLSARLRYQGPTDIILCRVDHFEPQVGNPSAEVARRRLDDWMVRYPQIAARHRDWDGYHPAHSFFYPWDEYNERELCSLAELCAAGWGEIEIHLHHRDDTDASLRAKLRDAVSAYRAAGALSQWPSGQPAFGFVHGNWALDNSRSENGRNYCGVNNELTILREEGCYADFTFPAWQQTAQPRQTNSIFYAVDDPGQPKSYDRGRPAGTREMKREELLLIQGPLAPFMRRGFRLGIDDGDLAVYRRYSPERLDRWVRAGIHVIGHPKRIFIKLHTHGAHDDNRKVLLGDDLEALFADAEARYNDGEHYRLHYVTAREMFNLVKALEAGEADDLQKARDYILPPPAGHPGAVKA